MTTDWKFNINREVAKISTLLSGSIDKYKYLLGKETLPFDQSRMIKQCKFKCSPVGKGSNW